MCIIIIIIIIVIIILSPKVKRFSAALFTTLVPSRLIDSYVYDTSFLVIQYLSNSLIFISDNKEAVLKIFYSQYVRKQKRRLLQTRAREGREKKHKLKKGQAKQGMGDHNK